MPSRAVIKVIQNRDFLVCSPDDTVQTVAAHMKRHGQGAVLVVAAQGGPLVGICTERDLAFKVLAEGLDPQATPVQAIMTANPQTVTADRQFGHALHLMFEGGFRHMPVVDANNRPMGVICSRDALGLEYSSFAAEVAQRETLTEIL